VLCTENVLVIDTSTNTVTDTVPVGSFPKGIQLARMGKKYTLQIVGITMSL